MAGSQPYRIRCAASQSALGGSAVIWLWFCSSTHVQAPNDFHDLQAMAMADLEKLDLSHNAIEVGATVLLSEC